MQKLIRNIKKHKILTLIFIAIIFSLSLISKIYKFNFKYKTSENTSRMEASIQSLEKEEEDKISYLVKYNGDKFILNIYKNKYSKLNNDIKKYDSYKYGDVISFRGNITIPEKLGNPYEFDYKKYLNSKNIVGTITTYEIKLIDVKINNLFVKLVYDLKDKISNRLDNIMPKEDSNLFKSMLYGEDKFLDDDIKEDFKQSGLSHLLAVSGSNIATLMMVISYISKKLNKSLSIIFTLVISYAFCIFCSFELSILRASLLLVITNISRRSERKLNTYLKIFFSFILICIYNPFSVFNIGMIMSYLAVISIVMFQNQIFSFFDILVKSILNIKYIKPKGIKKLIYNFLYIIIFPLSFTISVQILLFPIQIYFFNSFYLITFLSNIVISYIDNIFSIIGFVTVMLSYLPYVSNILANVSFLILKVIIYLVKIFSKFEFLNLKLATPDIVSVLIYYACIMVLNYKKYIILYIKRKYRNLINVIMKSFYILAIMYILCSYVYANFFSNYVIYFNVEQGNMALIHYKGKNIIVDIGSTKDNLASNIIINYLNKKNISSIDAVILTHFHTDHINGINDNLLSKVKIKKVIYAKQKEEKKEYINILSILNKYNISKLEVTKDEKIQIGDINIDIISPDVNNQINDEDVANANSIVMTVSVGKRNLFFMGDATKNTEKYILENTTNYLNNIYVYQVGHHRFKDIYFK